MEVSAPRMARAVLNALRKKWVVAPIAGGLLVAIAGTAAMVTGQHVMQPAPPAAAAAPPPSVPQAPSAPGASAPRPVAGLVELKKPEAGFQLSYPADWTPLPGTDPGVTVVAKLPNDSFQVRTVQLTSPVDPNNLAETKALADRTVLSAPVKLLAEPGLVTLGGAPAFGYLYAFKDPTSGQTGVHAHYIVFKGQQMITLVLQSVPIETFPSAAPAFEQIKSSFRIL